MARARKVSSYQISLIPDGRQGYTVIVPALPGCISFGRTVKEAAANGREAIELHIENLASHQQVIPKGNDAVPILTALVEVNLPHVA